MFLQSGNFMLHQGLLIRVNNAIKEEQVKCQNKRADYPRDFLKCLMQTLEKRFWILSMNTLIAVVSGILLGVLMVFVLLPQPLRVSGVSCLFNYPTWRSYAILMILGLIGSYLSNLLSKSDFLFVRGGPFWRYFLYHLLARPILGSFAAVFIFWLEKTDLLFSIDPQKQVGYIYIILAVVSGFAAEKIFRTMIDRILKKLEQNAEKTKQS